MSALIIVDVLNDFISGSLSISDCPAKHNGEEVRIINIVKSIFTQLIVFRYCNFEFCRIWIILFITFISMLCILCKYEYQTKTIFWKVIKIAKFVDTWNFAKKTVLSSMIYQLLVYDFRAKRKINYPRTTGTCSHKIMQQSRTFKVKFIIIPVLFRGFHIIL